ncbi:hypothetical protein ACQP1S_25080 [Micromonospora matsumotoense]|uniref:hypothetical protein n=1 Tax=Micromonospora matsumotoense TaxID=121616 RepID=UPI003D92F11E
MFGQLRWERRWRWRRYRRELDRLTPAAAARRRRGYGGGTTPPGHRRLLQRRVGALLQAGGVGALFQPGGVEARGVGVRGLGVRVQSGRVGSAGRRRLGGVFPAGTAADPRAGAAGPGATPAPG